MNNIIELFKKQKEIIPFLNDNSKNSLIVNSTINSMHSFIFKFITNS